MTYGTIKVDTVIFTDAGVDKSVTLSGLVQNPTFSGNVTVTGTLSGVTVTGTTANFTSGNFTNISGGTHTITSGVFAAGSAASPSITFTGDLNTGIYSPGADQVAISTSSSERIRIGANGEIGLGGANYGTNGQVLTSAGSGAAPTWQTLSVSANSITQGNSSATVTDTGSDGRFVVTTEGSERLRVDSSGRLGVGTASPQADIQAGNADGSDRSIVLHAQNNGTARVRFREGGTVSSGYNEYSIGMVGSSNALSFEIAGPGEVARIDSSGRLLVGTSSARANFYNATGTAQLQVEGITQSSSSISVTYNDNGVGGPVVTLNKSRSASVGGNTIVSSGDALGNIYFQGNDGSEFVEAALIRAEVDGTPGANDMPGRLVFSTTADGASSPTEWMRLTNAGQLRIGSRIDLNPDQDLGGSGNNRSVGFFNGTGGSIIASNAFNQTGTITHINFYNGNGAVGSITTNGSATAYNTSSDFRLKENVVAVTDGITRLQKLKPSRFNFIADPAKTVDGFIAHEVQAIVPEAITGEKDAVNDDGTPIYQGIDQSKLVPLLTAALQEAVAKIESLEARLTAAGI